MKKRLTALTLALCVFAGVFLGVPAAWAESYTVYVISNTLPVYQASSETAKKLGTMAFGESMTCVSTTSSGWAKVKNTAGATGYCKTSGLSATNPNTMKVTASINTANTPVYKKPATDAKVWLKLKKGATYTAVAMTRDNAWVRLKNGKYYGYVQAKYLSTANVSPSATPAPSSGLSGTVYAAVTKLPVYQSASASSKKLGNLYYGQSVTCVSDSGGWAKLRSSTGVVGYCQTSGVTDTDPNSLNQKVYINTANAPVYQKPVSSAPVWTKLKKNASYTAVAITPDGDWVRLKNGSKYGYIPAQYVSAEKTEDTPAEQTAYVTAVSLPIYTGASENDKLLGHIYLGESIAMIGASDGWAKVRHSSGAMGYCLYSALTTKDPNTLNKAYFAKNTSVKLYQKPDTGAAVADTVPQNTSLMAVCASKDGKWARIALSKGGYAYALASDLAEGRIIDNNAITDITPVKVYATETSLTVYDSPKDGAKSLGKIYFGQAFTCNGKGVRWARIVSDGGIVGYCDVNAITTTDPNNYSTPLYAQSSGAKLYQKPLTSSKVLATLELNAQVTGLSYNSDRSWYRVQSGTTYGYVDARYFATSKMNDNAQSGTIGKIVSLAKEQLGIPYVYYGQTPGDGFDCSGFVYYVFKNAAGISLKRTAYSQGYDESYKKITNLVDLKVGDLLFFNTVYTDDDVCDHVGIYLGGNQFIHASSGGGKVMISTLGTNDSSYYYRNYSWARRIIS